MNAKGTTLIKPFSDIRCPYRFAWNKTIKKCRDIFSFNVTPEKI